MSRTHPTSWEKLQLAEVCPKCQARKNFWCHTYDGDLYSSVMKPARRLHVDREYVAIHRQEASP